ncbi:MAG: hypothetical protein JSU70_08105 [Phycisphaerales bacterium]|nr:MAG: hypothetical protein JSU70_08105 [Phycisphaerales bacterium]
MANPKPAPMVERDLKKQTQLLQWPNDGNTIIYKGLWGYTALGRAEKTKPKQSQFSIRRQETEDRRQRMWHTRLLGVQLDRGEVIRLFNLAIQVQIGLSIERCALAFQVWRAAQGFESGEIVIGEFEKRFKAGSPEDLLDLRGNSAQNEPVLIVCERPLQYHEAVEHF